MSSTPPQFVPEYESTPLREPDTPVAPSAPPEDPSIAGYAASDRATSTDTLGFKPYVEAIASFLIAPDTEPPITISIEGEWGSGKSSFLLQLEAAIKQISATNALQHAEEVKKRKQEPLNPQFEKPQQPLQPPPHTLRFNAWRHDKQDQLWAAFALAFVESLRKEIGWRRALWGDAKLFFRCLHGFKAWAELALLIVSLFVSIVVLWRYHSYFTPDHVKALLAKLTADPKDSHLDSNLFARIASHGFWGALASLAIAGFLRFKDSFKLPLSLDLKKYLAKPDYEGHTAFIEHFHKDLQKVVRSYAGRSRVFVFIDDLDRCDVPKAAELMQALNLMIGDCPNLVFILGMDREKVAAGIALKYKDLFPFLRESALWKPNVDRNDFTPLYFGYAYLEKFIQLSFALPIPNTEAALNQFLASPHIPPPVADDLTSVVGQWLKLPLHKKVKLETVEPDGRSTYSVDGVTVATVNEKLGAAFGQTIYSIDGFEVASRQDLYAPYRSTPPPPPVDAVPFVTYHRVTTKEDNERTRAIVRMTAPLFEYNPRRIKQFTNTFRLALFLFSDLGLFDALQASESTKEQQMPPTAEQVGKIIALLLRFPDLRFVLDQNPGILRTLQEEALRRRGNGPLPTSKGENILPDETVTRWLNEPGAIEVVAFKVQAAYPVYTPAAHLNPSQNYSLVDFPVSRLFTILPRAARPPAPEPAAAAPVEAAEDGTPFEIGVPSAQATDPLPTTAIPDATIPNTPIPDTPIPDLARLAREYEQLRADQPPSPDRTNLLEKLYAQLVSIWEDNYSLAVSITDTSTIAPFDSDGERIVFLALAQATVRPAHTERLLRMATTRYRSRFEHYCCLRVLQRYVIDFPADQLQRLLQALDVQWDDISKDPPRLLISNVLRSDAMRLQKIRLQTTYADGPPSQPPIIISRPAPSDLPGTSQAKPRSPASPPGPASRPGKVAASKKLYK